MELNFENYFIRRRGSDIESLQIKMNNVHKRWNDVLLYHLYLGDVNHLVNDYYNSANKPLVALPALINLCSGKKELLIPCLPCQEIIEEAHIDVKLREKPKKVIITHHVDTSLPDGILSEEDSGRSYDGYHIYLYPSSIESDREADLLYPVHVYGKNHFVKYLEKIYLM